MNTLSGTGDKNVRREDSNTNENMNNILTSNVYLHDQTINCSQTERLDTGVEIIEIHVRQDKNHNFSNHVKSYADGTDFWHK